MEKIEKRTLLRTIFSKLKGYYKYRKTIFRLKIRANVHRRIKREAKVLKILLNNKKFQEGKRKKIEICKKKYETSLKDKSLTGFIKCLIRKNERKKKIIKAISFFKYTYLYKSILSWKNLNSVLYEQEKRKSLCNNHNKKRLKKYLLNNLIKLKKISRILYQKKSLYNILIKYNFI